MRYLWSVALLLLLWTACAHAAPPRMTQERLAFLVVSDASNRVHERRAETVIERLHDLKTRNRMDAKLLPILQYHWNKTSERAYCMRVLHLSAADLPFVGIVVIAAQDLPQRVVGATRAFRNADEAAAYAWRGAMDNLAVARVGAQKKTWIGIGLQDLEVENNEQAGFPEYSHVRISFVAETSPAARAGLRIGDVLLDMDGAPVESAQAFVAMVRDYEAGRVIRLRLFRPGEGYWTSTLMVEPVPQR